MQNMAVGAKRRIQDFSEQRMVADYAEAFRGLAKSNNCHKAGNL
jgi:hypothetical protein